MAYMSQEKKATLAPAIKAVLKKYGMKGTIGVRHHSTLVCNIKEGPLDICGNVYALASKNPESWIAKQPEAPKHIQVNQYHIDSNYTGKVKDFLLELKAAMSTGNHDRSDIQVDYFDVGWYIDINVGQWDKPYSKTC